MNQALKKIAQSVRNDILTMSYNAQSAHMGGALSVVEILVSLYFNVMNVNTNNSLDPARDRLVLSKAHDAKALYSVLARRGFFDLKVLDGYEKDGGNCQDTLHATACREWKLQQVRLDMDYLWQQEWRTEYLLHV